MPNEGWPRMALYNINKFTVESILEGVTDKGKQEIVKKLSNLNNS